MLKVLVRILEAGRRRSKHIASIVRGAFFGRRVRTCGQGPRVGADICLHGGRYISIGSNFSCFDRLRLEAFDEHNGFEFKPYVRIGDNVSINYDCHIACVNGIEVGDGVLIASRVFITDHFHGNPSLFDPTPPSLRRLHSAGPVTIGANVWIGEGVSIMPGVTIGVGAIVGANSVVTRDIPSYAVAAGVPARVIRRFAPESRNSP